jgi:hypothetical protein
MFTLQFVLEAERVRKPELAEMQLVFELHSHYPNVLLETCLLLNHQYDLMVLVGRYGQWNLNMPGIVQMSWSDQREGVCKLPDLVKIMVKVTKRLCIHAEVYLEHLTVSA